MTFEKINTIEIWAPRYSTGHILIAPYHIMAGVNRIVFTKTKHKPLLMDGARIKSYPMETNGKIGVYCVPIKDFTAEPNNQEKLL